MPRYKWTRSDPFKDYANDRVVEEGEVVEISDDIADPAYGFVEADESDANSGDGGGETQESDASESESADADGAADTPIGEKHWRTAVSDIEAGEYDDRLESLLDGDRRQSVREALEGRQAGLAE